MAKLLKEIYRMMGFEAARFSSDMDAKQREDLQGRFNTKDPPNVFIVTYDLGGVGLNLQGACYRPHLFDPPLTQAEREQAIGRTYRLGQFHAVLVIEYEVCGTYNDKVVAKQMVRALPELAARFDFRNAEIIEGKGDTDEWVKVDDDGSFTLVNIYRDPDTGGLRHVSPSTLAGMDPFERDRLGQQLRFEDLMLWCFQKSRGTVVNQHGGIGDQYAKAIPVTPKPKPDRSAPNAGKVTPKSGCPAESHPDVAGSPSKQLKRKRTGGTKAPRGGSKATGGPSKATSGAPKKTTTSKPQTRSQKPLPKSKDTVDDSDQA